jgi:hypothetical protein
MDTSRTYPQSEEAQAPSLLSSHTEAIRFYCGIGEQRWNRHPVAPGPYGCISPVYGSASTARQVNRVFVPQGTRVLQDSGAFSDGPKERLSLQEALNRQEQHAERFGYACCIEARSSYDVLIDEMWSEDERGGTVRVKRRWSETEATLAVEETVQAAKYLRAHRNGLPCILSVQGVSSEQYQRCAQRILPYLCDGDLLGLGGWCITGKFPAQMMPVFRETMYRLIPFLSQEGIKRVHLWGVCYAPALGELLWLCDQHHIRLSTDSMGPCVRPAHGRWGYAEWTDPTYRRVDADRNRTVYVKGYDGSRVPVQEARGIHRAEHVRQVRAWLTAFRSTRHYPRTLPHYITQPRQMSLL